MSQPLNKLFHCVYQLNYHLVLVTKYRKKCINSEILKALEEIVGELLKRWDSRLIEFNGESDHIHLLIELNPKITPSVLVNNLKTVTSRLIRRDYLKHLKKYYWKDPVFWSRSYCILTCGGAPLSVIKQYIANQKGTG
jgi:putative transposase